MELFLNQNYQANLSKNIRTERKPNIEYNSKDAALSDRSLCYRKLQKFKKFCRNYQSKDWEIRIFISWLTHQTGWEVLSIVLILDCGSCGLSKCGEVPKAEIYKIIRSRHISRMLAACADTDEIRSRPRIHGTWHQKHLPYR